MFLRSTTTSGRAKFQKIPCISPLTGNLELETGFAELAAPPRSPFEPGNFQPGSDSPLCAGISAIGSGPFSLCGQSVSLAAILAALSLHPKIPFLADRP